jgi:hypothetical protein
VDRLVIDIEFPAAFEFKEVKVDVLEAGNQAVDVRSEYRSDLCAKQWTMQGKNKLRVCLEGPAPHFRYRIRWTLPDDTPPAGPNLVARRNQFERNILGCRAEDRRAGLEGILQTATGILLEEVYARTGIGVEALGKIDACLMVCDRTQSVPMLRMAVWNAFIRDAEFTLQVGLGNAGSAFKTRSFTFFDSEEARKRPESSFYLKAQSGPPHTFMISAPLLNLEHPSLPPLAILNFGAFTVAEADLLRCLVNESAVGALHAKFHGELLTDLYKTAKLKREVAKDGDSVGSREAQHIRERRDDVQGNASKD